MPYTRIDTKHLCNITIMVFAVCFAAIPALAVKMEKDGPGYLTDSHGACGVLRTLTALREDYPECNDYIKGTLQWLYDVRIDNGGAYSWKMSASAPKGHPSSRVLSTLGLSVARAIAYVDPKRTDPIYRDLYEGSIKALEKFSTVSKTKSGPAHWLNTSNKSKKFKPLPGVSHGTGGVLVSITEIYEKTKDKRVSKWATGTANLLKDTATTSEVDGLKLTTWPRKGKDVTGFCYGTGGIAYGLVILYKTFPEHRFYDGTSALDLAMESLNWVLSKKIVVGKGWTYEFIRSQKKSTNPGWGSGVTAIGETLMEVSALLEKEHPKDAARYLDAACKNAIYAIELVEKGWDVDGKHLNIGLCGGVGATGRFLLNVAERVQESDPNLAERARSAAKIYAGWFPKQALPCGDGVAWVARNHFGGGFNAGKDKFFTVNMAFDYGLSGMVFCLNELDQRMDDEAIKDTKDKALKAMLGLAVKEGEGYKWPLFSKIPAP